MPVYKDTAANRKLDRVGKTYGKGKATEGGAAAPKAKAAAPKVAAETVGGDESVTSYISMVRGEQKQITDAMNSPITGYVADEGDGIFARREKQKIKNQTKSKFGTLYRKETGRPIKLPKGQTIKDQTILSLIKINLNTGKVPLSKVELIYNKYKKQMNY